MTQTPNCPHCGASSQRVIYIGLPMWLCEDDGCNGLFGFWSTVAAWLPISSVNAYGEAGFAFFAYDGWYLPALWHWLTNSDIEESR